MSQQRIMELQTYLDNMHIEVTGFQMEAVTNGYMVMVRFRHEEDVRDMRFVFEDDLDISTVIDPILAKIKFQKGQEKHGTFEH